MLTERTGRFPIALLFASVVHTALLFGIDFERRPPEKREEPGTITLVLNPPPVVPEKIEAPSPESPADDIVPETVPAARPMPVKKAERRASRPSPAPVKRVSRGEIAGRGAPPSVRRAERRPPQEHPRQRTVADQGGQQPPAILPPKLSSELLSRQIAEVSTALSRSPEADARRPRMVYVDAISSHKYTAAAYEQSWQQKIERIGNLNYPDEARRQKLSGSLILTVGVRQDGRVYSVKVRRSSGHPELDEAAERIVRLAAPFAPFPADLKREADVLIITRTWRFYNDYRLETH